MPPPLPSRVPPTFQAVASRCLEKEPARRYRRAGELRAALETVESERAHTHRAVAGHRQASCDAPCSNAGRGAGAHGRRNLVGHGRSSGATLWCSRRADSINCCPSPQEPLGDPAARYFADGMTESMITQLAQTSTARVISRSSVMRFKPSSQPLQEIARALGVDAIVDGSVLRDGDRVRISGPASRCADRPAPLGPSFDRDLSNVLVLQSEVAQTIAGEIETRVGRGDQPRLAMVRPSTRSRTRRTPRTLLLEQAHRGEPQTCRRLLRAGDRAGPWLRAGVRGPCGRSRIARLLL